MPSRLTSILCFGALGLLAPATSQAAEPAGHVTGVGGIFFKAQDPKALAAWYRDVLGLPLEAWGGALLRHDAPQHPPVGDDTDPNGRFAWILDPEGHKVELWQPKRPANP